MGIQLNNISKSFSGKELIKDLTITFPETGIYGVFGPSGSGKTTLIRIICGLEKPDKGDVIGIEDKRFSVVFQEDRLIESQSILKNVSLVSNDKKAKEILKQMGLSDSLKMHPRKLSGGMKRRVAIARALAFDGDIMILDEPFKGLEDELKERIQKLIVDYSKNHLVILITHDKKEKELAENQFFLMA